MLGLGDCLLPASSVKCCRVSPVTHYIPWYAPRCGPGGQHDPTVTNQRPSGTVKPHASSRGTGSSLRAGCQPHAWWWGGMAPEAKASGKARGYAEGRPVVWKVEGPVGVHTA